MRIALLADGFPSSGRPTFVFVQQLVFALVDMGVDVSVVAPQSLMHAVIRRERLLPRHSLEETIKGNTFNVYRPYALSFGNRGRKITQKCIRFNQHGVNKVLQAINPDVLYGHFWHSANKLKQYALTNRKPLFVACGEGDNAIEDLISLLSAADLTRLKNSVRGVISVSSENRRKCVEYGLARDKDIIVLPNCTDDTLFNAATEEERQTIRNRLGVDANDFFVLFVGGFIPRKGADRVSRAIDKIASPHLKSAFIGKAMAGVESQPTCKGIVYKGTLEHDKLPDYYRAADVFCLPTLNEGCCNAIVESLSCGTPVISSARPFNDDILNEDNSLRINPESVDEIADAITKLMVDKEKYNSMKQYALNHSGDYSIDARSRKIIAFIKSKI